MQILEDYEATKELDKLTLADDNFRTTADYTTEDAPEAIGAWTLTKSPSKLSLIKERATTSSPQNFKKVDRRVSL